MPPIARQLLIFSLIAIAILVLIVVKRIDPSSTSPNYSLVIVTDFVNDWNAGHMIRDGKVADIFNTKAYSDYMDTLWGEPVEWHTWSYPPHLFNFVRIFGYLDYFSGFALWSILGLIGCYWVLKNAPSEMSTSWKALVLTSPAFLVNIMGGQTGFFCATLLVGGLYILPKRPILAGILFGTLTLKPHLGIMLALALLVTKQWKTIATAMITAVILIALSILQWGIEPWIAYLTTTRALHTELLTELRGFYPIMMVSSMPALRIIGVPLDFAWAVFLVIAGVTLLVALSIIKRENFSARAILTITLSTLLVTPYAFNYDMPMVSIALAVYLSQRTRLSRAELGILPYVWLVPALVYLLNIFAVPMIPVFLIAALVALEIQSRKEAAQPKFNSL